MDFRRRFRVLENAWSFIIGIFKNLGGRSQRPEHQYGGQRMCPFCGLITPRAERFCLECGKPLRGLPGPPKNVPQG